MSSVVTEDTKKCPFCAENIQREAVVCRFCNRDLSSAADPTVASHQNFKMTKQKNAPAIVAVFMLIVGGVIWGVLSGGFSSLGNIASPSVSPVPNEIPAVIVPTKVNLTIIESEAVAHDNIGQPALVGKIKNDSGRNLTYSEVKVEFLDANGKVVGTGMDNTTGLANGASWHFEVGWPEDVNAKSARVVEATGQ